MKTPGSAKGWLAAGAVVVGLYLLVKSEAAKALAAVNPLNPANIFNTAASSTYTAITGSTSGSMGSDLYGAIHNYLRFPDGSVKTYNITNVADDASYWYDEQFDGGVPSTADGTPLTGG